MKNASAALISFLENATTYVRADLYTFTLNGGGVLRYSSANMPVTASITVAGAEQGPFTWNLGPPIQDAGVQSSRGVSVSSVDVTILGGDGRFQVGGLDILDFIDGFGLDGATARIDRAYAATWSDMLTKGPVGTYCRFAGRVSEAKEQGQTQAVVTLTSFMDALQASFPAEVFQTPCLNTFGDANCGVNVAALTVTGSVVSSGGTQTALTFDTTLTHAGDYFALGVVTFTSGANNGIARSVKAYSIEGGGVLLTAPVPAIPQPGDTFTISPGCSLALTSSSPGGCQQWQPTTWQERFRGFPWIPPPTTGLPT